MGTGEWHLDEELLTRAHRAVVAAQDTVRVSALLLQVSGRFRLGLMATRCAWCGRYEVNGGWRQVHASPLIPGNRTSHSICEDCFAALQANDESA